MTPPENTTNELGVKIGTALEALWTEVAKEAKSLMEQSQDNIIIQKALLTVAEENIEIEKKKMAGNR